MKSFNLDSQERLDFVFDFTKQMARDSDQLASSEIQLPASGIEQDGSTTTDVLVRVWLQNAVVGVHTVRCKATTNGGRVYRRAMRIEVSQ